MDKNNVNNTNATTGNTEATNASVPPVTIGNDELMKMKMAYAQFEAESRKNTSFGEKLVESIPYIVSGVALAGSGVAIGIAAKSLNTTTEFIKSNTYTPSPDGELE